MHSKPRRSKRFLNPCRKDSVKKKQSIHDVIDKSLQKNKRIKDRKTSNIEIGKHEIDTSLRENEDNNINKIRPDRDDHILLKHIQKSKFPIVLLKKVNLKKLAVSDNSDCKTDFIISSICVGDDINSVSKQTKSDVEIRTNLRLLRSSKKRNVNLPQSISKSIKRTKLEKPLHVYRNYKTRSYNNNKVFKCSKCKFECSSQSSLKQHGLTHSKLVKCRMCNFECEEVRNLKKHMSSSHSTSIKDSKSILETNEKKRNLKNASHSTRSKSLETKEKNNTSWNLFSFFMFQKFSCDECFYQTNLKDHFNRHLLSHSKVKLFQCKECDYATNFKKYFNEHERTHSQVKRFKCSKCAYECNRTEHLNRHSLRHMNVKLFKCRKCDYECNQKYQLRVHYLSHSNTKLYSCDECEFKTNWKSNYYKHLTTCAKRQNPFTDNELD